MAFYYDTLSNGEQTQLPYHHHQLVELDHVSIHYGRRTVCSEVNFTVKQGDRIALLGANGSGKSSILKLICGEEISFTGTVRKGSQLNIPMFRRTLRFCRAI